ncbi:ecdysone oxidase-like [Achroia grisella]|uniref:ecdysone oxidase-like n=1 Tax=Achroia grisella TaxID=688607 RepID=UPI0027D263C2|nr:ecdysone oxidase-like [Achroia grisella]
MDVLSSELYSIKRVQSALQVLATTLHLTSYLYPQQALVSDGDVFDYIVVGAGSAGCVIANRLTEDPRTRVLLVEAGGDPPMESVLPGLMSYLKHSAEDWNYTSAYDGYSQQCHVPPVADITRGKMLGGCSSINYMDYVRGNPHDYNTWANITKDDTWKYENVLPYFIKSERLEDPNIFKTPYAQFHGRNGYLSVTRQYANVTHKYLKAFSELGHNIVFDTNGDYTLGYSEPMLTMADGYRQSTATAFLSPIKTRPNLYVLKNTLVTKINFDKYDNAISIEAIKENDKKIIIMANKEIIVSAGTINSAQLLMLSGIGPKNHLESLGINVVSDLPVGENLQDHITGITVYAMDKKESYRLPKNPHDYPLAKVVGYVAMNESQSYPDYQTLSFITDADSILQLCTFTYNFKNEICASFYNQLKGREVMFSHIVLLHPKSRGRILLRSVNPYDYPLIYTGHLSNPADLETLAAYIKDFNRVRTTNYFKEVKANFLVPSSCSIYEPDSKEYWKCHALCLAMSVYHYAGTCSMGSVVDGRLRVFGVQRLRVADASVLPTITSGNTNAPIIMVAEKVADFIKADNIHVN